MKKTLLLAMLFLPLLVTAEEPVKAFGSIYFGMTKKEVRQIVRNNREAHVFTVGDWSFKAAPLQSAYMLEGKGLGMFRLVVSPVPFEQILDKERAELLLTDIKRTFMSAGYKLEHEHHFFPKPVLLVGEQMALLFSDMEKEQYIFVSVPHNISGNYVINIDIMWSGYAEAGMLKKEESIEQSIQEVDDLF